MFAADPESSRAASRKTRVYVFREFLLEKYNLEKGDVVLDVAGGAGTLSWLLNNVDGVDSVVADPRKTKTNRITKSIAFLREHPDEACDRAIPSRRSYQPLAALMPKLAKKQNFTNPRHLRILVDEHLVEAVRLYLHSLEDENEHENGIEEWIEYWKQALERGKSADTLGYREEETISSTEIIDADIALQTILEVKLIIGFHPDQATDSCIDLARELGVPFCIVPCCVFPSQFPHRKLPNGNRVQRYDQLLDYLKTKDENIVTAKLPFNFTDTAKNIALFTINNL